MSRTTYFSASDVTLQPESVNNSITHAVKPQLRRSSQISALGNADPTRIRTVRVAESPKSSIRLGTHPEAHMKSTTLRWKCILGTLNLSSTVFFIFPRFASGFNEGLRREIHVLRWRHYQLAHKGAVQDIFRVAPTDYAVVLDGIIQAEDIMDRSWSVICVVYLGLLSRNDLV